MFITIIINITIELIGAKLSLIKAKLSVCQGYSEPLNHVTKYGILVQREFDSKQANAKFLQQARDLRVANLT
jgi:hypothetical protein